MYSRDQILRAGVPVDAILELNFAEEFIFFANSCQDFIPFRELSWADPAGTRYQTSHQNTGIAIPLSLERQHFVLVDCC